MSLMDHVNYLFSSFNNTEITKNAMKAFIIGGTVIGGISILDSYCKKIESEKSKLDPKFIHIDPNIEIYDDLLALQNYQFISDEFTNDIDNICEIYNLILSNTIKTKSHLKSCIKTINDKITLIKEQYDTYWNFMENPPSKLDLNDVRVKQARMDWTYKGYKTSKKDIQEIKNNLIRCNRKICK